MNFGKVKVADTLIDAQGNVPKAMVIYISRYGCNGFKCNKCPLGLICNHYPQNAEYFATIVLNEIDKRTNISSEKK